MNKSPAPKIAGIGEILWDLFPEGKRLGGAPANFACHCRQLGGDAYPVSCLGNDDLGREAREELSRLGINADFILESGTHPTGRVLVTLDDSGKPKYRILEDVAWDYLTFTTELKVLAHSLNAVCFGLLSQRCETSCNTIRSFLREMPKDSIKILDVNLRPPFYTASLVEDSLHAATLLKLSDEELPVLADYFDLHGTPVEQMRTLLTRFDLDLVAYTRGSDGSLLVGPDREVECSGLKITPIDSVGAGDSFTAALCMGLLRGRPLEEINVFANRVAAFVCTQEGACPTLPDSLTDDR